MKFCGRIRGLTQSMHGTLDIRPDQVMLLFLVMELSTHCDSLYSGIQTGSSNLSSLPRTRRNAGVICNGLAIHMKGGGGRLVIFFITLCYGDQVKPQRVVSYLPQVQTGY